ncbi:unnamed protein product [Eruca vesicaria subsp. sativa]|uniref:Late embryogenesis abundant protein LEA-2 subgroup domain-containing protein n=1 Tax=Eruca vesicaria subsp. sativa TaxID=29727 RepID=A0ABC8M107_ERUVS|nr:unnamed protein product [Eruca vesicaria subsp. sativa]
MAVTLAEIVTGETDPPPPPLRLSTRNQLKSLFVRHEKLTKEQNSAINVFLLGLMTSLLFYATVFTIIEFFPTRVLHCNVTFYVESISVSPSSSPAATWHVDFLVNHPSSRCLVHYDDDGVYATLGFLNTVVLKTSHTRLSRVRTSFSVDLATVGNQTDDVVAAFSRVLDLELKLSARKKQFYAEGDDYGHIYITCQNLILGYETIKCHSSFKKLKDFC